jgi:hypothetical protein
MKTNTKILSMLLLAGAVSFSSCKKDEQEVTAPTPAPPAGETELITNVNLTFVDVVSGETTTAIFADPDGDGGESPTISAINLKTNTAYTCSIDVLDASNPSDVDTVTIEINAEGADHQFFYIGTNLLPSTVSTTYIDYDENDKPIGLSSTWLVGSGVSPSNATMKIVLRHEPNKSGANVSAGDITNAGGETDVEIDFPISIVN